MERKLSTKTVLSIVLAVVLVVCTALPVMGDVSTQEGIMTNLVEGYKSTQEGIMTNLVEGYKTPWSSYDIPTLTAKDGYDAPTFSTSNWQNAPDVYAINREEAGMLASGNPVYNTVEGAVIGAADYDKTQTDYYQLLTGAENNDWALVVKNNDIEIADAGYTEFYKPEFSSFGSDWKTGLTLPSSWTGQGFDYPIYTGTNAIGNVSGNNGWPQAPTNYNPTGLYIKHFAVDEGLYNANGRIYISLQGVESCYYVYVNGNKVGYSEDTYTPHSFDVTDYLNKDGDNVLAIEVRKYCDGVWTEDQDMFRDGGIFRDIYLYSAPLVHIRDYSVVTDLDENYENATLKLDVELANSSKEVAENYKVDVRLYDENGAIWLNGSELSFDALVAADGSTDSTLTASLERTVYAPKLWSAEHPNLYTLVLSLYNSETGVYFGSVSQQLGFREIEFVSTQVDESFNVLTADSEYKPITINGQPLLFKGVNYGSVDAEYGKHVPADTIKLDLSLMKQYNINAVRTSHYGADDYFYYLCNKFGLYVMAEANIECHSTKNETSYNNNRHLVFEKLMMDKTVSSFKRLRNCTANVMWSYGNESYEATNTAFKSSAEETQLFAEQIWYYKNNDPTRPVHSESAKDLLGVDVSSNMYPATSTVAGKAQKNMPYVMCEYAHAMGNGVGNLKEYWDIVRSNDAMMGGFIWDWVDQARLTDIPEGTYDYYAENFAKDGIFDGAAAGKFYGYGGDFKETTAEGGPVSGTSGNFAGNGIVSTDREPQPEIHEVKYQYQSFWLSATNREIINETVTVYNENNFADLSEFDVSWELTEDGRTVGSGTLTDTALAGKQTRTLKIPYQQYMPADASAEAEYHLNVYIKLKEDTDWGAKAGHDIAHAQFEVPANVDRSVATVSPAISIESGNDYITVAGNDFSFKINKTSGIIEDYVYKNTTLMTEGPVPSYWRAVLSNDYTVNKVPRYDPAWQTVNNGATASSIDISEGADGASVITVTLASAEQPDLKQSLIYSVSGNGAVKMTLKVDATDTTLGSDTNGYLRIGTYMTLPEGFENVEWYGLGPVENMYDRKEFATVGRYSSTVSELFYPYHVAQDTGTLGELRYITVTDPDCDMALAIAAEDYFEAQALHFTADDLTAANHTYELHPLDETVLTVNMLSRGTGNGSCGPGYLTDYLIPNTKEYSYSYTILPYNISTDAMEATRSYRTSQIPSIDDVALSENMVKINEVKALIDGLVVDYETTTAELDEIKAKYDTLPESQRSYVGEDRIEKLNDAYDIIKMLAEDPTTDIKVTDKSKNGYIINVTLNPTDVQPGNGTVAGYEGGVGFMGGEYIKNNDGSEAKLDDVIGGTQPFTLDMVVNPANYINERNTVFGKGDDGFALRFSESSAYAYVKNTENKWVYLKKSIEGKYNDYVRVTVTYDGSRLYLSVDSDVFASETVGTIAASTKTASIGCLPDKNRYSQAVISSLHLFSGAISKASEVNGLTPDSENTVMWFDFGDYTYVNGETLAADEVIKAIDGIKVVDNCVDALNGIQADYDALSDYGKTLVGSDRLLKLSEAIALAEKIENSDIRFIVKDKSNNGFAIDSLGMGDDHSQGETLSGEDKGALNAKDGDVYFIGSELLYDADGNTVSAGNYLGSGQPFTIEALINVNNVSNVSNIIFSGGDDFFTLRYATDHGKTAYQIFTKGDGSWPTVQVTRTYDAGEWVKVVAVYDGDYMKLSVGGEEFATKQVGNIGTANALLAIGLDTTKNRGSYSSFKSLKVFADDYTLSELSAKAHTDADTLFWFEFDDFSYEGVDDHRYILADEIIDLRPGDVKEVGAELRPYYTTGELTFATADRNVAFINGEGRLVAANKGVTTLTVTVKDTDITKTVRVAVRSAVESAADLNGDLKIDICDLVLADKKLKAGQDMDVNGDSVSDASDLVVIRQIIINS